MATPEPVFHGTPDQWWEQAEPITEEEAAERMLGTWYIVAETRSGDQTGSYHVGLPTHASNIPRRDALARRVAAGDVRLHDIAPHVRALVRSSIERPEWLDADLVIADAAVGSADRVPWRRKNARWLQVFDATRTASERTMVQLNPTLATISELNDKETS